MAKEQDMSAEQNEGDAELYIRLFPYMLRDFMHREDLKGLLLASLSPEILLLLDFDVNVEGTKQALFYKDLLDNGEESLSEKVKPVINL